MSDRLTNDAITAFLEASPHWRYEGEALHRSLKFKNFSEALAFLVRIGIEAEKRDHHPELRNVYATVDVALTTHDAGGVTSKDVDLAGAIDAIAEAMGARDA